MSTVSVIPRRLVVAAAVAALFVSASCDDDTETRISTADAYADPAAVGDDLPVEMIIYSSVSNAILDADVPANVAESATLIGSDDQPTESIELPADELFPIAPGTGYILLESLTRDLELGDRFEVTLVMEEGDPVFIPITVGDE